MDKNINKNINKKLGEIFEDVAFVAKHKRLNWVDYEIYKSRVEGLGLPYERLEEVLREMAEVMGL